ncbi:possible tetrapyrrole methyltransferase domain / Nucleoside triphosphate pyrophosphohydrolase MazG [hydrothermal vent metagenome]|uniref:Possible tetrapyrrole methyltransferase domain / Nucleoside triphosphate pyrophosphohydrolase MazG n=1 Tax=hydrothermal vent metagenome TaxID=652676 RepID=A0A3B0V5T2_9ZZZZ
MITVVGLGPGNGRFLTRAAWDVLRQAELVYLRTERHPAVADLPESVTRHSFDAVYDAADNFEAVYDTIVAELLQRAQQSPIIYAVPGHPFVGESTVTKLVAEAEILGIPVKIVAGLSFVEPCLTAVRQDGMEGVQIFDGIELTQYHYPPVNPDFPLLLGQVYSRMLASELKLLLTAVYPDEHPVTLIHQAGDDDQTIEQIPLYAIDRSTQVSHLTSLFIPPLPQPSTLAALAETVAVLRSPEGCPWDQEQTPQSLRSGFLEEASEVLDALDANDVKGIREELGDVFYHLVMQAQMAREAEEFRLTDVLAGIEAKLKYRHPHVWGDWQVADSVEVVQNWETLKAQEKSDRSSSLVDNIPAALPALAQSQKIQARVRLVGFDWPTIEGVYEKLQEEVAELRQAETAVHRAEELGDLLFVTVNLAKWMDIDAESALREANLKFSHRFRALEQLAAARQLSLSKMGLDALEALWQEVKGKLIDD